MTAARGVPFYGKRKENEMTNTFGKVKALCAALVMWLGLTAFSATPTVTSVTAQQRYPWNGLVDIVVTFNGAQSDVAKAKCAFAATNSMTKAALAIAHITQQGNDTGSGTTWARRFVWDTNADVGEVKIDDVELVVDVETDCLGGVQLWEGGPYWAECNVGATKPEEFGNYFWWGGTERYSLADFPFADEFSCPIGCMSNDELYASGFIDSIGNLTAEHDAATVNWGMPWRMPTDEELTALASNCVKTDITHNGVHGLLITGTGSYASKSIFLPYAGYGGYPGIVGMYGLCWSSTYSKTTWTSCAWGVNFGGGGYCLFDPYATYQGGSVRPVRGFLSTLHMKYQMHLSIDNRTGRRVAKATERIRFSPAWETDLEMAVSTVSINGVAVTKSAEEGVYEWTPKRNGTYVFTHAVSVLDVPQGETLTATFEVRDKADCVVHFNANGGVFRGKDGREVKEFDQYFVYGEPQKLFTDDLVPMRMDGSGNKFLGWVRGTPEITSSDDLIDAGKVWPWNDDVIEETFYAVWTTTLKVMFYNNDDKWNASLLPASLADHLTWSVEGETPTHKSGESIEVGPGVRKIKLQVDDAYSWIAGVFDLGDDNAQFNAGQNVLTLNVSNDCTDSLIWSMPRQNTRNVYVKVNPLFPDETGRVRFVCVPEIRESLSDRIKMGDVPFDESKVHIALEEVRPDEDGNLVEIPAHLLVDLRPSETYVLPKSRYVLKSVSYDADWSSGDPYWGAVLWVNLKGRSFEVENGSFKEIPIDFDMFGGDYAVKVEFDPQGGKCAKSSMWFTYPRDAGVYGGSAKIDKKLPKAEKAGFGFEGWFTTKSGGKKIEFGDSITDWTLFAHWKTKVTEDWLLLFPELAARAQGDVEAAASLTAANGCRTVGECYELGINPEDSNDDFKITGFELKDGKPVIQLNHTKDGSGNSFESRIKTLGKARLSDVDWVEVTDINQSELRFFKAMVDLP